MVLVLKVLRIRVCMLWSCVVFQGVLWVFRPATKLRARTRLQFWTVETHLVKGLCSMVS